MWGSLSACDGQNKLNKNIRNIDQICVCIDLWISVSKKVEKSNEISTKIVCENRMSVNEFWNTLKSVDFEKDSRNRRCDVSAISPSSAPFWMRID